MVTRTRKKKMPSLVECAYMSINTCNNIITMKEILYSDDVTAIAAIAMVYSLSRSQGRNKHISREKDQ